MEDKEESEVESVPPPLPLRAPYLSFEELAKGANEVVIEHDNQLYRLRLTRNGKLILNK